MNDFFSFTEFFSPTRFIPVQETVLDRDNFSRTAIDGRSIKILNWNIAKNNNDRAWKKDFFYILETYHPDLVCLQEVELNRDTKRILALESMGWNFAPNFIDRYYDTYCGILTGSQVKPIACRALLTPECEPVTKTPKVSLIAEYPLNDGQPLLVVNAHAINFVNLNKFQSQLHTIEAFLRDRHESMIMCGDFNTWSQLRLDLLNLMANRLNLTEVHFPEWEKEKIKKFLFSPHLDRIYYRDLRQKRGSSKVLETIYTSDHKPMLVELFL